MADHPVNIHLKVGAYVARNWVTIRDGLLAGKDWYRDESHEDPRPNCGEECDLCNDYSRSENWLGHAMDIDKLLEHEATYY